MNDTNEQLKEIKRSFRLMMNGVAAQSMRDKGLDYHVNWGASVPMLKAKAKEIGKNRDLAIEIENKVRESLGIPLIGVTSVAAAPGAASSDDEIVEE